MRTRPVPGGHLRSRRGRSAYPSTLARQWGGIAIPTVFRDAIFSGAMVLCIIWIATLTTTDVVLETDPVLAGGWHGIRRTTVVVPLIVR